jgi:hypothetical protein
MYYLMFGGYFEAGCSDKNAKITNETVEYMENFQHSFGLKGGTNWRVQKLQMKPSESNDRQ